MASLFWRGMEHPSPRRRGGRRHRVTAGLTLPWSSGVVERHVNGVKTLKRAMYGRASFELLQARFPSTRYDETPDSYLAGLHLRASMIWINDLLKTTGCD